ncbi:hypothetical protein [Roseovarius sp. E0-M6]|uniref:hypothetical protein n=1 Tax=Roseovarius sp. E0-M6 TaxID=3127118 RepID=UPI00300FBAF4
MHVIHSNVRIAAARKVAGSWLDRPTPSAYLLRMRRLSSILLLAFLAVFAVGNIAHAVSANDMALEMAVMDDGAMAIEDCQGCPTDGEGADDTTLCQLDCTAPGAMALTAAASIEYMIPTLRHDRPLSVTVPHGQRSPPDPFPPRPFV